MRRGPVGAARGDTKLPQLYGRDGEDFLVHTSATGSQSSPSITVLASGGFVMTWQSSGGDGGDLSGTGIRAQIFDASGARVGTEFDVNAATLNNQSGAVVTALPDGGFVVAWCDSSGTTDTSYGAVTARIFTASGVPAGDEFPVNTLTAGTQAPFAVTVLESGNFVIGWSDGSSGAGEAARAQIFTASGEKVGGEILLVNSYGSHQRGDMIALPGGGFAFAYPTWYAGVKLQMFDASGAATGSPIVINGETDIRADSVSLAVVGDRIIAAWGVVDGVGGRGIEGQILGLDGVPIGPKFQISTYNGNEQERPTVMAMPGGEFMVTWQSDVADGDTLDNDIRAQMFAADGSRIGGEFSPAGSDPSRQVRPETAMLPSGEIVVAWYDYEVFGHADVRMQILTPGASPPTDIALSNLSISEGAAANSLVAWLSSNGALNADYTYTIVSDSSGGAFGIGGNALIVADAALLDYETQSVISLTIRVDDGHGGTYQESVDLAVADVDETVPPPSDEILVASPDYGHPGAVYVTSLASGGWLVTYARDAFDAQGDFSYSRLAAQRYDAGGNAVGPPLSIGGYVVGGTPSVAELASGEVLISWVGAHEGYTDPSGAFTVGSAQAHVTLITPAGDVVENGFQPLGSGTPVTGSAIVVLESGGFAILWDEGDVRARLFDADLWPIGQFSVAPGGEEANFPGVERLADGNFLVTWREPGGAWEGQLFDSAFAAAGPPFMLLPYLNATNVSFTAAAGGGFAVAWAEQTEWAGVGDADKFQLKLQLFDASGAAIGETVLLLMGLDASYGFSYALEALPEGGFMLTWQAKSAADPYYGESDALALRLDAAGYWDGPAIYVDSGTLGWQGNVDLGVLQSGDVVFGWNDGTQLEADVKTRTVALEPPTVQGTSNPDTLDGDGGDLVLSGYGGDDTYFVESGDTVVEQPGEGYDLVAARTDYALEEGSAVEWLAAADSAATDPLALTGNGLDNRISGNAGANRLDGGGGADSMDGRGGNDLYIVDHAGDEVREFAGEGADAVESSVTYTLPDEVERLTLTGAAHISAFGNAGANSLYGNGGHNVIDGRAGADRMSGGEGNDTYYVDDPGDRALESSTTGGVDTVYAAIDFSLAYQQIERLILTGAAVNATGNSLNNTIVGTSAANVLNGMGGVDVMNGGAGDDTYIVDASGESVIETAGGGNDTVLSSVTFWISRGYEVETLILTGTSAVNGYGNELANRIEGNGNNNILNGSTGADTMVGKGNNDTYFVDDVGDLVVEEAGGGVDTVHSAVSYTLPDHVENGGMSNEAALDIAGNALVNRIYGNGADNRLDGGAGADYMTGRGGNDTYVVDDAADRVYENNPGDGTADRILASVSYGLGGIYVETLELTGTGDIAATGNSLANALIGNGGANNLFGKGGNDTLTGGAGADGFWFDTSPGAGNVDAILDFSAADDTIFLSRSVFKALGEGTLSDAAFVAGTAAQDADDRIVYDAATGRLWYDGDGSGAGAAILFATVTPGTALTSLDFSAYTPG